MMPQQDKQGQLRHRRGNNVTTASSSSTKTTTGGETIDESKMELTKSTSSNYKTKMSLDSTDGYVLIPLKQRSIFMRLDVGPFATIYSVLISLDYAEFQEKHLNETWHVLSHWIFPIVLLAHVVLFLLQQWNVYWRASVGYQKVPMSLPTSTSAPSNQWTHCLVQAPQMDQHEAAHEAGIVDVDFQTLESENDTFKVALVNFQDIIFRCCPNDKDDADVTLWSKASHTAKSSDKNSSSAYAKQTGEINDNLAFRRLAYPTQLPLSLFLNQWRGHVSMSQIILAKRVYGTNETPIQLPPFLELLQEQVVAPFFLFQVLCVILWSLDEYWYYAIFTFFALLMFESTVAFNRKQSLQRLRSHTGQDTTHSTLVYVYRPGFPPNTQGWVAVSIPELVPGDIISCKMASPQRQDHRRRSNQKPQASAHTRIPADILVLQGDAVVDESLLTGESVPQLKVPINETSSTTTTSDKVGDAATLDMQEHKQSILFGGTNLLVSHGVSSDASASRSQNLPPPPPDEGVVGIVLKTGWETAQGSLLRTMAHTQKSVDGIHTADTYVFILLLLCCAVLAARMVWTDGWNDPTRNKFRLTLHVIIIVTSVVPPELPMELSLAVTNSVTDLMKRCQVYCTELFRIPLAGQVDVCCFDKTGTLTSDEMRLQGVRTVLSTENVGDKETGFCAEVMNPGDVSQKLPWSVARILTGCHSLGINGRNVAMTSEEDDGLANVIGDPLEKAVLKHTGYRLIQNNALRLAVENSSESERPTTVLILHRFGFSSRLKRMSVLAREDSSPKITWVLTKGAPETIKDFLKPESIPPDYDQVSMHHMGLGQRVLALAYRRIPEIELQEMGSPKDVGREIVERDLTFAGFLLLDCPLKPDSSGVIAELQSSGHDVVMITGDAILTAAEVARQVGIIRGQGAKKKVYPKTYQLTDQTASLPVQGMTTVSGSSSAKALTGFCFVPLASDQSSTSDEENAIPVLGIAGLRKLVSEGTVALCVTGDALSKLAIAVAKEAESDQAETDIVTLTKKDEKHVLFHPQVQATLKELVPLISVFARHAPRQKEAIVAAFNLGGLHTLMAGDGCNDVGALRRAHVGISIISAPEVEAKQRSATATLSRLKAEEKRERKERKKGKTKSAPSSSSSRRKNTLEETLRQLQEAQNELDHVELGDASAASPFTSRTVSIKCCKDVVQQGRCTLVTMLQIYKILGINCLVNAMVLSKLFLHGVKQGDRQLTILGVAVAALFLFVTRGKPLPTLSPVRPPSSVLCAQALLSIAAQFAIHFAAIMVATEVSLSFVDPYDPSMIPDGPFNPNTLNTCTFLMNVLATVNTFAVNYRGRPFMEDLWDNKLLLRSLQVCYGVLLVCALEIFPPLNDLLQLTELPDAVSMGKGGRSWRISSSYATDTGLLPLLEGAVESVGFPIFLSSLMLCDTMLAFAAERMILRIFDA